MLSDIEIVGAGMHPFGRFPQMSLRDLTRVAVIEALRDAGIGTKDIDKVYCSNSMAGLLQGQEQLRGQTFMREIGIEGIPIVNVENACAGGSTALREAVISITAGVADVVLVVGVEKMFVRDRDESLRALRTAADVDVTGGLGLHFPAVYAMRVRLRLADGSLTEDDLVNAAVKSHLHGSMNPYAQHQNRVTPEEVRASRPIADPLTLLMCSSICDGSAALIVARTGAIDRSGRPGVRIKASQHGCGLGGANVEPVVTDIACRAYEEAGVGPHDIDVWEVHDAMAPSELIYYEQLGLCERGEAGRLLADGVTTFGGAHLVNPSGGLSSRGHPVGATGVGQVVELVWQLRGEAAARQAHGARLALAQNSGGWIEGDSAAVGVHILERVA